MFSVMTVSDRVARVRVTSFVNFEYSVFDDSLSIFIFRPHKWGRKIMICDAFFKKFCQNSTLLLHILVTVAQSVVRLPGRHEVMGSSRAGASQPVGRGFEPLLRHTFFAISVSRKISRCSAGVLLLFVAYRKKHTVLQICTIFTGHSSY